MRPTLIFDLDNTLVECGKYYLEAQDAFAAEVDQLFGLQPGIALSMLKAIDLECTKLPNAFARDRFPRSFDAAYAALAIAVGRPISQNRRAKVRQIGDAVFDAPYTAYRGIKTVLRQYRAAGWRLVLCSKGDNEVQLRKLRINNLDQFFTPSTTYITLKKSADLLRTILEEQEADLARTWYVGDSMRDDIGPALEVGIGAIRVAGTTKGWAYENENHSPTLEIADVNELVSWLPLDHADPRALVPPRQEAQVALT